MIQYIPSQDQWGQVGQAIGQGFTEGYMDRADQLALQKAMGSLPQDASARDILESVLGTKLYNQKSGQALFENYLGAEKFGELKRQAREQEAIARDKNEIARLKTGEGVDKEALIANYEQSGMPRYQAELMADSNVTPATKQAIAQEHKELVARGIRAPVTSKTQSESPQADNISKQAITPEQEDVSIEATETPSGIDEVKEVVKPEPKKPEWPVIAPPPETTLAEKEKWRSVNQKDNSKLLKETSDKAKSHTNALLRYKRLSDLNNSKKLPSGMGSLVINPETGEPWGVASLLGLVNKETQDFVKTMNDFLIDAKNYFGSRVTNFDISAFKSRLPTLLNSEDGRRLIIEQMKIMEDLQIVHDKTLSDALKHYGRNASYIDIQKVVDDKISQQEEELINKMNNLDEASHYLDLMSRDSSFSDRTLMQDPEGKFKAVKNSRVKEYKDNGYKAW